MNLDLKGKIDAKNLLSFYKQKIILLENQNSFLLNQNNFLQHGIDQNNKITLKILNNNSQVENNLQKSDNSLQESDKKNPLVEVVKEKISKLPKSIKTAQKQKKFTKERKTVFIIGDSMIKGLAERGISKDHNMKVRPQPGCTTEGIEDHKPIICKNPDVIIIHSGTNHVTNDKPTKKKIEIVVKLIEDANPDIQVIISGLIHGEDCEVNDEIASTNNQLIIIIIIIIIIIVIIIIIIIIIIMVYYQHSHYMVPRTEKIKTIYILFLLHIVNNIHIVRVIL